MGKDGEWEGRADRDAVGGVWPPYGCDRGPDPPRPSRLGARVGRNGKVAPRYGTDPLVRFRPALKWHRWIQAPARLPTYVPAAPYREPEQEEDQSRDVNILFDSTLLSSS